MSASSKPTECPLPYTTACPNTTGSVGVKMLITATAGTETYTNGTYGNAILIGPSLWGSAVSTQAAYIVSNVAGNQAPYDFGMAAGTVVLELHNPSAAAVTLPSTLAFTVGDSARSPAGTVSGGSEFTLGTLPTGTAKPCSGGQALAANANDYCTLALTWTPGSTPGTREVNVAVGSIASINVSARVATAASLVVVPSPMAVSGTPLDFGSVVGGVDSLVKTLTVRNVGELATVTDLDVVTNTGAGEVTVVASGTTCEGTNSALAAGASCTLALAIHPTTDPALHANVDALKIVLVGTTTNQLASDIYLSWNGINAAKLNPDSGQTDKTKINFDKAAGISTTYPGTAVLQAGTTVNVTLTNPANSAETGPLSFRTDADDFSIDLDVTHSTCLAAGTGGVRAFHGLQPTSGAADSCVVRVVFVPTKLVTPAKVGNLIASSTSGATVTIPLSGTAIPALSVGVSSALHGAFTATTTAASAAFAFSSVSTSSYWEQTFTFTKATGSTATGLLSTSIGGGTGATPDQFKIVTDNCIGVSLKTGAASCDVTVRFAPTSGGANKNAVLTVMDPSSGTPADSISVALTGTANASH